MMAIESSIDSVYLFSVIVVCLSRQQIIYYILSFDRIHYLRSLELSGIQNINLNT